MAEFDAGVGGGELPLDNLAGISLGVALAVGLLALTCGCQKVVARHATC